METLWRTTLARNPDCWMAHSNLGLLLKNQGRIETAIEHYHQALQIDPNAWDALNDLGVALAARGQFDEAIKNYRKALQIDSNLFAVQNNLGHALADEGQRCCGEKYNTDCAPCGPRRFRSKFQTTQTFLPGP